MNDQENGDRNKHTRDTDQATEIPAVVMIDRADMTVGRVIEGLAMGAPENLQLANVPPISLEEVDHFAFHVCGLAREYLIKACRGSDIVASDWEPTAGDIIALLQQSIFWMQFFSTLLYQPAPEVPEG